MERCQEATENGGDSKPARTEKARHCVYGSPEWSNAYPTKIFIFPAFYHSILEYDPTTSVRKGAS